MDREKSDKIVMELEKAYPMAECTLDYEEAYHLLVSVRLAAQCTDARVNMVTPALFAKYPDAAAMAAAPAEDVEELIRSTGFYHGKARDIVAAAKMITEKFGGRVPDNMADLLSLPGVGRKSANLILGDVYGVPGSVVVDTHCIRLTGRLGYHSIKDPEKIEYILRDILPAEKANDFCHRLVMHGRAVCTARAPRCAQCVLHDLCQYAKEEEK